jgi:WD40 repeat protein
VAVLSRGGNAQLFDLASLKKVRSFALGSDAAEVTVDADGSRLAAAVGSGVQVYDTGSGRLIKTIPHPVRLEELSFSPDGSSIAAAGSDHTVWLSRIESGAASLLHTHKSKVVRLAYCGPQGFLMSADERGRIAIYPPGK